MRCDSHVHVVGPADRYAQVPQRTYLADVATVESLQRNGAPHGITRFVIVQPSFYGIDNSTTLHALDALAGNGRGVAVIDPAATPKATLADYHRRGVRGLRINLYSPMSKGPALGKAFAATAKIASAMGWHVQVIAPLPVLLQNAGVLARAKVPVVIDHYGLYGRARPEDDDGQRLLELTRHAHVWIKLSAPYRLADGPMSTRPDPEWVAELIAAAPSRCVWGSDWPHPPSHEDHSGPAIVTPYRALSYDRLVEDFIAALPGPAWADRIMRDNAARLYGF